MSTKIWTAYRTKPGVNLWQLIASIRVKAEKKILRTLAEEVRRVRKDHKGWGRWQAVNHIRQQFRNQYYNPVRSYYGMELGISIRERRSRFYIIPYANGLMSKVLDFLRHDPRLEDFHYQNQTDKSAKCSDRSWETRGRIWDELDLDDTHWNDKLVLEIFNPDAFWRISYPILEMKGRR